jgi:hypothetical protein
MSCCGQHRDAMRAPVATVHPSAVTSPPNANPQPVLAGRGSMWSPASVALAGRGVQLRYRERAPVRVRGPVTGQAYEFSVAQSVQVIDARDAQGLLRTRMFLRAV